jgi:hypothetical protein
VMSCFKVDTPTKSVINDTLTGNVKSLDYIVIL